MDSISIADMAEIGANGALIFIIWNLFKTNEKLVKEINSRDEQLVKIINYLLTRK
ncbi:MAG: hypothetical protein WBA13_17770 [Microcoleaceae cyanobacterium]